MDKKDFEGEKNVIYDFIEFNLKRTNNIGNNVVLPNSYYSLFSTEGTDTREDNEKKKSIIKPSSTQSGEEKISCFAESKTKGYFVEKIGHYSDALLKLIDEIISNAVDIIISPPTNPAFGKPGDIIKIDLIGEKISVYNNGPGFPLYKEDNGVYSVQQALSGQYTSTNYNDEIEKIQAGVNGQGSKLTNIYSRSFEVETVCFKSKQKYYQKFENNMRLIGEPVISYYAGLPYTKISFILDFNKCCLQAKNIESSGWAASNKNLLCELIFRRAVETQTYLSLFGTQKVYFNDVLVDFNLQKFTLSHSFSPYFAFGKIIGEKEGLTEKKELNYGKIVSEVIHPKIHSDIAKNFYVAVIFHDPIQESKTKYSSVGFKMINILNNVVLSEMPNYIEVLLDKLETFLKNHSDFEKTVFTTVKRKFPGRLFRDNITFITVGSYPKKYFDFKGQTKTNATFDLNSLKTFQNDYDFSEGFLKKFWEAYKANIANLVKPVNKNVKAKPKLYEPAQCLKKGKQAAALFIAEGNTALQLLQGIIEHNKELSRLNYGLFSIQGVPINAIKASTLYVQGPLQSEVLQKNIGFQSLVQVLGLNYEKKTVPRYARIIITTDQDLIGIGKICSLIIAFFMLYFPHLVREGFIWRYRTPIIRYYRGNTCKSFYSEQDFLSFSLSILPSAKCGEKGKEEVKYYKGLGCNSAQEVKQMAANFWKDLIKINYDEEGEKMLYRLYGEDTEVRKIELLKGLRSGQYINELSITLLEHLNNESISEQLDNIKRMTPNVIDGLLPCQRKVIAVCRRLSGDLKVSGLAGRVIDKMNYGYGETALQGSIKYMAQIFPGSNRFPLLLTVSDANGSQFYGRTKNPAARYCKVTTNKYVADFYPLADDDLLKISYEENKPFEPINYVPILPRILLEDTKAIATGWNSRYIGRKFELIAAFVKYSINNYPIIRCPDLLGRVELYPGMSIKIINGREYCLGSYYIEGNKIIITQLPLGLWGEKVIERITSFSSSFSLREKESLTAKKKGGNKESKEKSPFSSRSGENIVASVDNETGHSLRIVITLVPGALAILENEKRLIPEISAVEEYFKLYKIFSHNLNFFFKNGLKSYTTVGQIFKDWFTARRKLYIKRLKKECIRLKAEIILNKNILRFICNLGKKIDYLSEEEAVKILESENFIKLNMGKILKPQKCSGRELKNLIYNDGSYKYIFNITQLAYTDKKIAALKEKINTLKDELSEHKKKTWSSVWLEEINDFENKYYYGRSVGWEYTKI